MKQLIYDYEKFSIELLIPEEIEQFIAAAHIDKTTVLDQGWWKSIIEDDIFHSHEKHPTEEGYESDFEEPLSKAKKIKVLIHGLYLHSKMIFELEPEKFVKQEPIIKSSCNMLSGWRVYFCCYEGN